MVALNMAPSRHTAAPCWLKLRTHFIVCCAPVTTIHFHGRFPQNLISRHTSFGEAQTMRHRVFIIGGEKNDKDSYKFYIIMPTISVGRYYQTSLNNTKENRHNWRHRYPVKYSYFIEFCQTTYKSKRLNKSIIFSAKVQKLRKQHPLC